MDAALAEKIVDIVRRLDRITDDLVDEMAYAAASPGRVIAFRTIEDVVGKLDEISMTMDLWVTNAFRKED